jgi:putative transposase
MRAAGIVGCHRRRQVVPTVREPHASPAPDHLQRQFVAEVPDTRWTADITDVPTWSGFLSLAVVPGTRLRVVFSRRIVGWAMVGALWALSGPSSCSPPWIWRSPNRRPDPGVIHHSDHGCGYPLGDTSLAFGNRCQEADVVPSLGSRGDCYDHAITESFFATLEGELLDRHIFRTRAQARTALFDSIEGFSTTHRRHSALGSLSPAECERQFRSTVAA